jgi:hypothetical protein
MDAKLKKLINLFPEHKTEILDIYEVIKDRPKALMYLQFFLINKMDLNRLEIFIYKLYGKADKD